jgi:hypothetical protein
MLSSYITKQPSDFRLGLPVTIQYKYGQHRQFNEKSFCVCMNVCLLILKFLEFSVELLQSYLIISEMSAEGNSAV